MAGRPQSLNRSGFSRWPCFSVCIDYGCIWGNNCVSSRMSRFFPVSERNVYDVFAVWEVCVLSYRGSRPSCQLVFLQEERGGEMKDCVISIRNKCVSLSLLVPGEILCISKDGLRFLYIGFYAAGVFLCWCNKC